MLTLRPTPSPGKQAIVHDNKVIVGYALLLEDGFWRFLSGNGDDGGGTFEAHTLQEIADLLDGLNKPYNEELARYFASLPPLGGVESGDDTPF